MKSKRQRKPTPKRVYRGEDHPIPLSFTVGHNIEFTLKATPPNWRKFAEFLAEFKNKPDWAIEELSQEINNLIHSCIPQPEPNYHEDSFEAGWYDNRPKPRGNNKRTQGLAKKIRTDARWLYLFISYWFPGKSERNAWPEPLLKLWEAYKKDTKKKTLDPVALTIFSLRKVYAPQLKANPGLKPFENKESFKTTYLNQLRVIKDKYFKNATPDRVSAYLNSDSHPLSRIFKSLQE